MQEVDSNGVVYRVVMQGRDDDQAIEEMPGDKTIVEIDLDEIFLFGNMDFVQMPETVRNKLYQRVVAAGWLNEH